MSTNATVGTYDGVRELRSRLPDVSDTVIAHFLSKYNVEECYERLKNGYDESAEMTDSDSLLYTSQIFEGDRTNAHEGRLSSEQLWATQSVPPEISPSHFRGASWNSDRDEQPELPYPEDDPYTSRPAQDGEAELLSEQRRQLECIRQLRDACTQDLTALRADTENKRHALTALRIRVSEGPTILDTAGLQDIISTLEYDIQTMQNKIQVEKTQAEMKQKLDVYTEEGVRWNCQKCGFLNHPLMSRCERCDQTR